MRPTRRGFTLVELMVVIAIIGMLASVVAYNAMSHQYPAQVTAAKTSMLGLESALRTYKMDNGVYPSSLTDLWIRPGNARKWGPDPYIDRHPPLDPWGNPFHYEQRGRHYELVSYGADGAPGGVGEAQDLPYSKLVVESWDPTQELTR